MIGNKRNFPAALVVPNFENLEKWAQRARASPSRRREELVARPEVRGATTSSSCDELTPRPGPVREDQEDRAARHASSASRPAS